MTGPARIRLPNGRPCITVKASIEIADAWFDFYAGIGHMPFQAAEHAGRPLETFLRPRGATKEGSMLAHYANGASESLSLLMQHEHTPAQLYQRFRRGSLERAASGILLVVAFQEGLALDGESRVLAESIAAEISDGRSREIRK